MHSASTPSLSTDLPPADHGALVHRFSVRHSVALSWRRLTNLLAMGSADGLALSASLLAADAIRAQFFDGRMLTGWSFLILPVWWAVAGSAGLLPGWGLAAVEHLRRIVLLSLASFAAGATLLFLTQAGGQESRLNWILAAAFSTVLLPATRTAVRSLLCRFGKWGTPVSFYGRAEEVERALSHVRCEPGLGYTPAAVFTDEPVPFVAGVRVRGRIHSRMPASPVALLCTRGLGQGQITALSDDLLRRHRKVVLLPDLGEVPSVWVSPRDVSGLLGLEINQELFSPYASRLKRLVDLSLVLGSSPVWLPVCWALYIAIWLEDRAHPVYRQRRIGRAGEAFFTYKFRTMVPDAEAVLQRHLAEDPALRAEWEQHFKLRHDPRITRIGQFLRKTSLDELPQLLNVLRGEMALVGPRPLPDYHFNQLPEAVREQRHRMRPGLTGLWQVSGRSDAGNAGMIRWDPYYVRNWSVWLDLVILVRTVRVVLLGSGAR